MTIGKRKHNIPDLISWSKEASDNKSFRSALPVTADIMARVSDALAAQQREIEGLRAIVSSSEAERYAKGGALCAQIASLEQSNTVLGEKVQKAEAEVAALKAKLDRAAEALGPFAEASAHLHPAHPDDGLTLDGIEVKHWRRAGRTHAELTQES